MHFFGKNPTRRWSHYFFIFGALFGAIFVLALSSVSRVLYLNYSSTIIEQSKLRHLPQPVFSSTLPSTLAFASAHSNERCIIMGALSVWRGYVSKEFSALFDELRVTYGWEHVDTQHHPWDYNASRAWGSWGDVADALGSNPAPALLLLMEVWGLSQWGPRDPRLRNTLIWFWADDLHWLSQKQQEQKAAVLRPGVIDVVVGNYMDLLDRMFPAAAPLPRLHLPHAVTGHFLLPLNSTPLPRVLLAGSTGAAWYPYRAIVAAKVAAGDARFVQLPHPGYSPSDLAASNASIGADFANLLHQYLAVVTDGLTLNYTVAKCFEVPATGALLLVNSELTPHLAPLGFERGVHFVEYTRSTLDSVVDWVLEPANRGAVDAIRAQGQTLVWARHTVHHRAAVLDAVARTASAQLARPVLARSQVLVRTVDSIIFSKDRPMRLLALLESRARHCRNAGGAAVVVFASTPLLRAAYKQLEELFPAIVFLYEGAEDASTTGQITTFRKATLTALTLLSSPYIMALVDDVLFTRNVDLAHVASALDTHAPQGTFQLRLTLAYEGAGALQRSLVPFVANSSHDAVHCYSWSAALEAAQPSFFHFVNLDAGVYSARRVAQEWGLLQFTHPGELEMAWYASKFTYATGCQHLFYAHGAAVNVEMGGHVRPDAGLGTKLVELEADAAAVLRGERYRVAPLAGWNVTASHLVLPLEREGETGTAGSTYPSQSASACPWQPLRAPEQPRCTPSALQPQPFVYAHHRFPPYWLLTFGAQDYVSRLAVRDEQHAAGKESWLEWSTDDLMRRYLEWVQRGRGRGLGMVVGGDSEACTADPVWMLDVGANIGTHAISAAAEGFPVLALEAAHMCATRLACSKEANRFEHLVVWRVGVGAEAGETCLDEMSGSPTNVGGYKVRTSATRNDPNTLNGAASSSECVPGDRTSLRIATLADLVAQLEASVGRTLPAPAVLKMDCEGCEWNAVSGTFGFLLHSSIGFSLTLLTHCYITLTLLIKEWSAFLRTPLGAQA